MVEELNALAAVITQVEGAGPLAEEQAQIECARVQHQPGMAAQVLVGKLTDRGICHFRKSASKVFTVTNAISRKRASNGQAVFALRSGDEMIGFTSLDDYVQFWEKA